MDITFIVRLLNQNIITNLLYIIQDTPHFTKNPYECINSKKQYYECYGIIGINATINKLPIIKDDRIKYIDMNKYLCKILKYSNFVIDNCPVYKDDNHLAIQYANKLSKQFLKQFTIKPAEVSGNKNSKWYRCYLRDLTFH